MCLLRKKTLNMFKSLWTLIEKAKKKKTLNIFKSLWTLIEKGTIYLG